MGIPKALILHELNLSVWPKTDHTQASLGKMNKGQVIDVVMALQGLLAPLNVYLALTKELEDLDGHEAFKARALKVAMELDLASQRETAGLSKELGVIIDRLGELKEQQRAESKDADEGSLLRLVSDLHP